MHSELYKVDWLKETHPHTVWINPIDAAPRGLKNDDEVYVFNERGKLIIPVFVTEKIVNGVVAIFEGAWYDPDDKGVCRGGCVNVLTLDEHSGGGASILKTALVEVELAKEGE